MDMKKLGALYKATYPNRFTYHFFSSDLFPANAKCPPYDSGVLLEPYAGIITEHRPTSSPWYS